MDVGRKKYNVGMYNSVSQRAEIGLYKAKS